MPNTTRFQTLDATRAALCLLALLAAPATANAYIDPGTGSLLFQSLLAVLFGVGVAFRKLRIWLARFWAFILRRPRPDDLGE
jgi:hypothetical protein